MSATIMLELNELTPTLMYRFMEEGKLPNFKRLHDESQVFTTDAEEEGMSLNPWIQWVTVHTGLTLEDHGVFLLGEGNELRAPTLGEIASEAGLPVFLCGSMNIRVRQPIRGAVLPDAWATDVSPQPAELEPFFRFVSRNVQEHTNDASPLGLSDYIDFLRFMLGHGLSATTAFSIVRQLLSERSGHYGWRRVGILDQLQWDVFKHTYNRLQPKFSTFFLNSVAHLQHTHWRNLEPEKFANQPTPEEQAEFEDAILFGYQSNDRLIGRFLDLAGPDTNLVFCTALSQKPCVGWEDTGSKRFYRPRHFETLTEFAGIDTAHRCAPVMSEEFWVEFENDADAAAGETRLAALRVDGQPGFAVSRKGARVYVGCSIFSVIPSDARLTIDGEAASHPFFDILYAADSLKSGEHDPDGMLWIRTSDRRHHRHEERVPLTSVAPTILSLLGVDAPSGMSAKPLL